MGEEVCRKQGHARPRRDASSGTIPGVECVRRLDVCDGHQGPGKFLAIVYAGERLTLDLKGQASSAAPAKPAWRN